MLTRNARFFKRWNYTTACCFKYKTKCADCPNCIVCEMYSDLGKNKYNIHPIKYATLMTYSNIGVKGLEEAYKRTLD